VNVRFGQFEVDLDARELRKAGIRIKIHEQPFQVLEALLERPGELVTRDELRHRIWPEDTFVDFDQSLNKAVNRVRTALGDNAANPRFVETLSRRGYRLLVPVERHKPLAAEPRQEEPVRPRWKWIAWVAVLAGALAIVAAYALRPTPPQTPIRSLVVLPLTNLSGNAGQDYFVDGITEAITTELAGIPGLRVVSTTSAMQYKAAKKPLPVIASDLRVDGVIEGSLLLTSGRMRLLLKLIDARSERPVWTKTYEVDTGDVLRLQNDVARLLASEIHLELNPERPQQPAHLRRIDPVALDAYLKGHSLAQRRTEQALNESIEHFHRAIAADPEYARAYAGLGIACQLQITYHFLPAREGYRKQVAAATKALDLDDGLAEAHMLLAAAKHIADWDWTAAEKHFKRAIQLSPSYARNHQWYALALMSNGQFDKALAEIRIAQELDPLSVVYRMNEGEIYYNRRDYDGAIRHSRRAIEYDPTFFGSHVVLGISYVGKGMYNEGIQALEAAVSRGGGPKSRSKLGYALAKAGKVAEALKIVEDLKSTNAKYPFAYDIAVIYAGLGDKENAFQWLTKCYEERSSSMTGLGVTPVLDGLRSDPRFTALVNKVGLVR
jgi:TolB-like protein/DNA-binding winged helix-turn-helix (wHTH) protein/Flp pilus assembly protein TadD